MKSSLAHFPTLSCLQGANRSKRDACYLYYTCLKQKSAPNRESGEGTEPPGWSCGGTVWELGRQRSKTVLRDLGIGASYKIPHSTEEVFLHVTVQMITQRS